VVEEVAAENLIFSPGYLGIARSGPVVFVQVFLNLGRSVAVKQALYSRIAAELAGAPGLRKEDVLVSLVEVPKENWSFGNGMMSYIPSD
jgi:phenylpyruvate tautomerase PptA (4-oxalocrotonate tautomerase family)